MSNTPRKIIVMGATGHVGNRLINVAEANGHELTCIVREGSVDKLRAVSSTARIVIGDVTQPGDWMDAFRDQDQFIHLIGVIKQDKARGMTFEKVHTDTVRLGLEACKKGSINWVSHISALAAIPGVSPRYITTKRDAEHLIEKSGFDYTIFRPSMIVGEGMMMGTGNVLVMAAKLFTTPFPTFSPIDVDDLVRGLIASYQNPEAKGKIVTANDIRKLAQEVA